ncbi:MAG: replicative DNA helicase [Acidimicrobiia bacterium]|nr:replicative DNA helicase [Acidimicrobiia bacterium]
MTATFETRASLSAPPHSAEAEESVLGAVLLSSEAANVALEKLHPEDFYIPAHQSIFEAIVSLFDNNQPIDAVTVSESLRKLDALDRSGGPSYLAQLLDAVPTASNIEHYTGIVEEHALRRRLQRVGGDVTQLATRMEDDIANVLDRAEQSVFAVSERRIGEGLAPIDPLLGPAIEQAEELNRRGSAITGLPTGFRDLDRMLAGLHPSNLLIVAARPGMGKCLVGSTEIVDPKTGAITTIGEMVEASGAYGSHHVLSLDDELGLRATTPSNYFDNGLREVFTLTTRLGRRITATSNHPFRVLDGWRDVANLEVGDMVALPGRVDVFGSDTQEDGLVALLGYLLGDGTFRGRTPKITNASLAVEADILYWADQLGLRIGRTQTDSAVDFSLKGPVRATHADVAEHAGVSAATVSCCLRDDQRFSAQTTARVKQAAKELEYTATVNPLTAFLEDVGLMGCDAHSKFIPDFVFRLPERQVALFLSRLYATDGSAWEHDNIYRVEFTTVSERLARGVQHLLLRFGINAKLRSRSISYNGGRRHAWDVSFQDPDAVEAFAARIGIYSKQEALQAVLAMARSRSRRQSAANLLPIEVWDWILQDKGSRLWAEVSESTGRPRNHNWHVHKRRPSRGLVAELAEALDSDRLRRLSTSEVVWDPIVSIEPAGVQQTYDIEVPELHNFVANDIIVHNSSLALNMAQHAAVDHDTPVALFTLEMSREEVVSRMLCAAGRIDSQRLRSGQLSESDFSKLSNAASILYKKPIYVDDSPGLTVTEIRAKCRRMRRRPGLGLVVIDYLQLMQGSGQENRQQEIATISRSLKNLARELDVPVVALSQLNRSMEQREDKRPRLSDLRESGSLEQDADVVMFIYRHEYYHPEAQETKGIAEVAVAKHRQGATGRIDMTFLPEFTLFSDMGRDTPVL